MDCAQITCTSKYKRLLLVLSVVLCLFSAEAQKFGIPLETDLYLQKNGFSLGYSFKYRQAI